MVFETEWSRPNSSTPTLSGTIGNTRAVIGVVERSGRSHGPKEQHTVDPRPGTVETSCRLNVVVVPQWTRFFTVGSGVFFARS